MPAMDHDKELPMSFGRRASGRGKAQAPHTGFTIIIDHQDVKVLAQELSQRKRSQGTNILIVIPGNEIMDEQAHFRLRGWEELVQRRRIRQLFRSLEGGSQKDVPQNACHAVDLRGGRRVGLCRRARRAQTGHRSQVQNEALMEFCLTDREA